MRATIKRMQKYMLSLARTSEKKGVKEIYKKNTAKQPKEELGSSFLLRIPGSRTLHSRFAADPKMQSFTTWHIQSRGENYLFLLRRVG